MNLIIFYCIITMFTGFADPSPDTSVKELAVLFTGTTPCYNIIRPLHKISPEASCHFPECKCVMVEWKLTLYSEVGSLKATRYNLSSINRSVVKSTNMYSEPGTKAVCEGNWTILKKSKDHPGEVIYQLNPGKPELSLSLLKLNDNLLHILDQEGKLMIGNEFWSYTLSRSAN